MKNKSAFKNFMAGIGEMFDKQITPILSKIYWKALEPFTNDQCQKAFNEIILSSRFFPKPVDIIEAIQGRQENQSILAWIKVIRAIRNVGAYQSVKFDDPIIHSVIEVMGGWPALCSGSADDEKWKQKEFERLYCTMSNLENHVKYLPGIVERENSVNGKIEYTPEPPVLIGEFKKPLRLLKKAGER